MYFLRMSLLYPRNQKRSINYLKLYTKTLYIISKTTKVYYMITVFIKQEKINKLCKSYLKTMYFLRMLLLYPRKQKRSINYLKLYTKTLYIISKTTKVYYMITVFIKQEKINKLCKSYLKTMYFLRMSLLYPRKQKRSINYLKLYTKTLYIISKTTKVYYMITVFIKQEKINKLCKSYLKTMYFLRMLLLYPRNQKRSINYLKLYTKTLYIISKTTKVYYMITVFIKQEKINKLCKSYFKTMYFLRMLLLYPRNQKRSINYLKLYTKT